jgi:hypothetical protein
MVYDITNAETFKNLDKYPVPPIVEPCAMPTPDLCVVLMSLHVSRWLNEVKEHAPTHVIVMFVLIQILPKVRCTTRQRPSS